MVEDLVRMFFPSPASAPVRIALAEALRFEAHYLVEQFTGCVRVVVRGNNSLSPCARWWRRLPEPADLESRDNVALRGSCMATHQHLAGHLLNAHAGSAVIVTWAACH